MRMYFDRHEAKMLAKGSLRINRPNPMLVTAVYLLLTAGLSALASGAVFDPTEMIARFISWGYSPEDILLYLAQEYLPQLGMAAAVSILLGVYSTVMRFGYTSYALRLARNEGPGYGHLFDGFLKLGRVLWASILQGLLVTLRVLPALVVFLLVALLTEPMGDSTGALALSILGLVIYLVGLGWAIMAAYSYRLTSYFLLDDPACTARQAIKRSRDAMRGWRMELFILDWSFFGWLLLASCTMGLLPIWVDPYIGATEANFYDCVTGGGLADRYRDPSAGDTGDLPPIP